MKNHSNLAIPQDKLIQDVLLLLIAGVGCLIGGLLLYTEVIDLVQQVNMPKANYDEFLTAVR